MSKKYEKRIGELIRNHIITLIERKIADPRVAGITVTDVEISEDTRYAKVFWSIIGTDEEREQAGRGLDSAAGWLRHELGQTLRTRHTPQLSFHYDQSLAYGDHMSRVLDEVKAKDQLRITNDELRNANGLSNS